MKETCKKGSEPENTAQESPRILVVGAGISGMRAALDLAGLGYKVYLIDKAPAIGGILGQLDYQFPNNHCGMCRMLPLVDRDASSQFCLRKGLFHENITIIPSAQVVSVGGSPGQFSITLTVLPSGVDAEKCSGCGACEEVCPVSVPDLFNAGLSERRAIYLPVPHQIPNARVIDWNACTRCKACEDACPTCAITLSDKPQTVEVTPVAAVILASGSELFDPGPVDLYGMGHFPNVVTATAFERIMSSSGPYGGRLVRPSDGKEVKRVAWLQCVGSRNVMIGADHCSRACCMFAVKEAVKASEKIGREAETTIFYMDMRTFGRDFQAYRDQAEHRQGVRFVRCRPHSVEPTADPGDIKVTYVDCEGKQVDRVFDMVVLSTGQRPGQELPGYADQDGVFAVDSTLGLRDISESVVRAHVAAGEAVRMLEDLGMTPSMEHAGHSRQVCRAEGLNERPRFLAVLCTCGSSLNERVAWDRVEEELLDLPGQVDVVRKERLCTKSGWDGVQQIIGDKSPNRLLVGACNPYSFLPRIRALEKETGMPASFVEVVDLHKLAFRGGELRRCTDAVLHDLEMGLERLRMRSTLEVSSRPVVKSALIVGGGPSGMKAASILADHAVDVLLVEKNAELGGNLPHIGTVALREEIEKLKTYVEDHPRISIYPETEVIRSLGSAGQFASRIRHRSGREEALVHGATILATGGRGVETSEYGLGEHDRIVTLFDFETRLEDPTFSDGPISAVVMIQCVGSREEPRNYCSRICCVKSLKNALKIKEIHPKAEVFVFYRDMMTYGSSEAVYTEARRNGVYFIPFETSKRPTVSVDSGRLIVEGYHPILKTDIRLEPDWVSLAVGVAPHATEGLAKVFGVERTQHGFLKEVDGKWRPVDTGREGVFVCGLARAPGRADEAMREGAAAAQRATRLLARDTIRAPQMVARVRHAVCSRCQTCMDVCPYHARYVDQEQGKIMVDSIACQACGACAVACPNSATYVSQCEEQGILNAIAAAL